MPIIIAVVGNSNSGKTTLLEKLIPELKSRGHRVATVKHAPRDVHFDKSGTDSWRHIQAGSETTVISSPDRVVLIKAVSQPATLDDIARLLGEDYDIVLAEGFKQDDVPKIEVYRPESGPLLTDLKRLFAVVTDDPVTTKARQFRWSDIKGLADLLEEGFITPQRERLSLYVNSAPVTLSSFPREFIRNLVIAMAASLKGVKEVKSIDIFLNKGD